MDAFRNWPELPSPGVLRSLGSLGGPAEYPGDWQRGKQMQMELGDRKIPFKTECELGAGFWDRITKGEK